MIDATRACHRGCRYHPDRPGREHSGRRPSAAAAATARPVGAGSTGGCGSTAAGPPPPGPPPVSERPAAVAAAGAKEAEVYIQVLRRYLSTPADNSFPGQAFTTVYVLN